LDQFPFEELPLEKVLIGVIPARTRPEFNDPFAVEVPVEVSGFETERSKAELTDHSPRETNMKKYK
jgi:hypothetical protein